MEIEINLISLKEHFNARVICNRCRIKRWEKKMKIDGYFLASFMMELIFEDVLDH